MRKDKTIIQHLRVAASAGVLYPLEFYWQFSIALVWRQVFIITMF